MVARNIQLSFFFGIFAIALVLGFFILKPYINVLILALTFAVIFTPLYKKIAGPKRGTFNDSISALITLVTILIIVLIPLTFLGSQVFFEAQSVYGQLQEASQNETSILAGIPDSSNPQIAEMQRKLRSFLTEVGNDPNVLFNELYEWAEANFGSLFNSFAALAKTVLAFFLWLFAMFYFFKDGDKIQKILITASPLNDKYDNEIMTRLSRAVKSVIGGSLVVAIIQGILTGVGFGIFGVPLPFIWGSVAVIAALIPTVGTGLVNVPAALYLFATGNHLSAILLLVWAIALVGMVDNILRPILIEKGTHIHPLVILLSVLGGISLFGPIGFISGPLIMTLISEFMNIYRQLVLNKAS